MLWSRSVTSFGANSECRGSGRSSGGTATSGGRTFPSALPGMIKPEGSRRHAGKMIRGTSTSESSVPSTFGLPTNQPSRPNHEVHELARHDDRLPDLLAVEVLLHPLGGARALADLVVGDA